MPFRAEEELAAPGATGYSSEPSNRAFTAGRKLCPTRNMRSFIGATLLVAGDIAVLFGLIGQHAPSLALAAIPIALWEFSLGVWLVVKGFKPSPILSGDTQMPA